MSDSLISAETIQSPEGQACVLEYQEWLFLADGLIKMHNKGEKGKERQRQTGRRIKLEGEKKRKKEVN